jgi:hypothetical protein
MDMDKELNCSEGARMLIERMQTHPDDFKQRGRFFWVAEKIQRLSPIGLNEMSERDWNALRDAFGKTILEPWLTETVVDEIFNGEKRREEEQKAYAQTSSAYSQRLAQSMMGTKNQMATGLLVGSGFSDPRNTYGNAISNPAQGQVLWTEQEKPKAGRDWFEHEKQILKDMTKKTLAKLKRNKSK